MRDLGKGFISGFGNLRFKVLGLSRAILEYIC